MIYTSNYKNFKDSIFKTCSISGDKGVDAGYIGSCYSKLAPKKEFWKIWKDNIGKISEEENNKYYIEKYYDLVLSKLEIEKVYSELNYNILLCYEEAEEFCHRHIISAWFELFLGVTVPEIRIINGNVVEVERSGYIKECLEEIIKSKINMKGFNCLRALYLFECSNEMDKALDELLENDEIEYQLYAEGKTDACGIRVLADEVETEYNKKKNIKKRIYQK